MSAILNSEYWLFTESMYRCRKGLFYCWDRKDSNRKSLEAKKKLLRCNHHKICLKCYKNVPGWVEKRAITKHFNLLNSKEIKTFIPMKKGQLYHTKALLLCIREFWGLGWSPLRICSFLWLKSGKLKNGKWKSHSLVRTGCVSAKYLIHGSV